jgi:hypothetical protein
MCEAVCCDLFIWIRTSPRSEANINAFWHFLKIIAYNLYAGWDGILVGNTSSWKTKLNIGWRNITAQQPWFWEDICKEGMVIIVKPHM